jgi:anti-sigma B factor antagonist
VEVQVRNHENAAIIQVRGQVDLYTSPRFRDAILETASAHPAAVVVDLSGVEYMDSSGIATLVEGLQLSRGYGGAFRLAGMTEAVRQVFKFAKLEKVFDIYPDANAAVTGRRLSPAG